MSDWLEGTAAAASIPPHLRIYLSEQDYSLYTPIDQATWRFILRIGRDFFGRHAHEKYLSGLRETGISAESIPRIEEMDAALSRFGWRAVPVIGFIPPAAFLEFQSHAILPIACDMRKLEHLNYTPAPDIVHEAAGHAPIIADPAYAAYLRSYGEVSRRAIFSKENMAVYQAVRHLSDTKERPDASDAEIAEAERELEGRLAEVEYDSEVDWVTRLGWWTTEYGLVGDLASPQIYGAGLLSSIGESFHALTDAVRKVPLSIDCIHQSFNITEPQPQLFVTPDFEFLTDLLEELAERMSFRRGGISGLEVARRGGTVTTVELDTGLQISGTLADFQVAEEVESLLFTGPVQLAYRDAQLEGHGPRYHATGYSTPLGRLKDGSPGPVRFTLSDFERHGFHGGKRGKLEFASGIEVEGIFIRSVEREVKNLIVTFQECTVRRGETVLYAPEWGPFDLACGERVVSVFGNAADRYSYLIETGQDRYEPGRHKTNRTEANRALNELYGRVRTIRESKKVAESIDDLSAITAELDRSHPHDWLLRWELLELDRIERLDAPWSEPTRARLAILVSQGGSAAESIERGLALLR